MSDRAILESARTFASKLRQSEPVAALWQARAQLEADSQARQLLARLSERQRALALKQRDGGITRPEIDDLRRLQQQVETHPIIGAYIRTLQQAQLFLPAVNAEISELLGLDFAALARAASVYCPLP